MAASESEKLSGDLGKAGSSGSICSPRLFLGGLIAAALFVPTAADFVTANDQSKGLAANRTEIEILQRVRHPFGELLRRAFLR